MVTVIIDGKKHEVHGRLADLIIELLRKADRLRDGSKVLRVCLRKDEIRMTIEEDL